jgi:hypothetical protein
MKLDRLRVQLVPPPESSISGPGTQTQSQPVSADGTFKVDNLVPGDYRVTISGMPPGYYLKTARLDQADGVNQPLHLTQSSSGTLDVMLNPNGGQIEGTLIDDKQQAVRGIQAVLVPDRLRNRIDLYKTAISDQNGHFSNVVFRQATTSSSPGRRLRISVITTRTLCGSTNQKESSCKSPSLRLKR